MFLSLVSETLTSKKGTLVGECELVNLIFFVFYLFLLFTFSNNKTNDYIRTTLSYNTHTQKLH